MGNSGSTTSKTYSYDTYQTSSRHKNHHRHHHHHHHHRRHSPSTNTQALVPVRVVETTTTNNAYRNRPTHNSLVYTQTPSGQESFSLYKTRTHSQAPVNHYKLAEHDQYHQDVGFDHDHHHHHHGRRHSHSRGRTETRIVETRRSKSQAYH